MLNLELNIRNSLSLTPQLQQAIYILQLSNLELVQEIQKQLESNPLLEEQEHDEFVETNKNNEYQEIVDISEHLQQDLQQELSIDVKWEDIYIHQSYHCIEEQVFESAEPMDIKKQLIQQIQLLNLSKIETLIAYCIIDGLDQKGFLEISIDEIIQTAKQLLQEMNIDEQISYDQVLAILMQIQHLEPLGVASRSLVEYFKLQLQVMPSTTARQYAILLLEYYPLLIQQNANQLLKKTGLNQQQLKQAIDILKTLMRYPFANIESDVIEYQIPDVIVQKKNEQWLVSLNPEIIPQLKINSFYKNMMTQKQHQSNHIYLRQQLNDAKTLIKNINERHKTILKVAQCIIQYQQAFFLHGSVKMKPMVLRDIAQRLNLHESTISRAINQKYMLTPKGLYEFKYFFSSQVTTADGVKYSATAIQAMIQQLIDHEDPHKPLSDQILVELLHQQGVEVARRTIAKYREHLNIKPSSQRKLRI